MKRFIRTRAGIFAVAIVTCCGICPWQDAAAFQPEEPAGAQPTDPAVLAVLETNPTTPAERVRAIGILIDLGAAGAARPMLESLIAENLDTDAMADLLREFGTARFLKLALAEPLQPEGKQFADAVEAAATRRARDPERVATLIQRLSAPESRVRRDATTELLQGRSFAAGALVAALADPARSDEHAAVATALVAFRRDALGPLLAVLEAEDASLVTSAITILGRIGDEEAVEFLLAQAHHDDESIRVTARRALGRLLGYVPPRAEAAEQLQRAAEARLNVSLPAGQIDDATIEIWNWDAGKNQLVRDLVPRELAATLMAARWARDAYRLFPQDYELRRLYLRSLLEMAVLLEGPDRPISVATGTPAERAMAEGLVALIDVLEDSREPGRWKAAMAAADLIGRMGDADVLYENSHGMSTLTSTMRHPDRRVRMAAMESILTLAADSPYPGSSLVENALGYFAAVRGAPIALVADTRATEAQRVAGLLASLGYDAEIETDGRTLFHMASSLPEVELVLIDVALQQPSAREALAELRRDARTALLPVGITAPLEFLKEAERIAATDPLCEAIVRPHTPEAMQFQVASLLGLLGTQHVGHDVRLQHAARALGWLGELSAREQSVYDLRSLDDAVQTALQLPELAPLAAPVLARFGRHSSQRALVNLASREGLGVETREVAAKAFCASVARFGIQLTTDEIVQQYDRYNNSADRDVATQQILASVLDCIESPTAPIQPAEVDAPVSEGP